MTLTVRGQRCILALSIATAVTAGLTAPLWNPYTRALDCQRWTVPETDSAYARALDLRAAGWYGRADDHAERLYSPACR